MNQKDYYTAPKQEIFDEIKREAIKIWQTYDDQFGYATEKVNQIKDLQNVQDNAWYMVAMFDSWNQQRLIDACLPETAAMIKDAIRSE